MCTLFSVKALPVIVAWLVLAAQMPVSNAAGCPSLVGAALRACCCDQATVPVAATSCCDSDANDSAHADCSCALAPVSSSDTAIQSVVPALSRDKLPTAHQPNEMSGVILSLFDQAVREASGFLPKSREASTPSLSTDTPVFLRLCSILR